MHLPALPGKVCFHSAVCSTRVKSSVTCDKAVPHHTVGLDLDGLVCAAGSLLDPLFSMGLGWAGPVQVQS